MKNLIRKKKSFIANPAGFFSLFYYWLGPVSVIAYIYAIYKTKWSLPIKDWVVLTLLLITFIYSSFNVDFLQSIMLYRFHWGFLFFYLFFRNKTHLFNVRHLVFLMLALIVIEIFFVNFIISADGLPNYPEKVKSPAHFSDTWQRAYSYGGNSSVTGVLFVAMLSLINPGILLIFFSGVVITMVGSGSGMVAYLFYFISKIKGRAKFIYIFLVVVLWFILGSNILLFYKMSPGYLLYLVELKWSQVLLIYMDVPTIDRIFGWGFNKGGDFLWLHFISCHGYIGALIMIFFIFSHVNRINLFALSIIIIMTSHYFVLFSLPGQLLTGYLFAMQNLKTIK
ncbi:MAG: hypothetical protein HOG33_01755 [Candidatus Marinimicrobia bacterium]|jgi:hypothetical protein|nr:hypothetical protein [Candidatus Neomarinimicrobiota bacterium]